MKLNNFKGYTLIELLLVLVLSSLMGIAVLQSTKRSVDMQRSKYEAERMRVLGAGVTKFMSECFVRGTTTPIGRIDTTKSLAFATASIPGAPTDTRRCDATYISTGGGGLFKVDVDTLRKFGYIPEQFQNLTTFDKDSAMSGLCDPTSASNTCGYSVYIKRTPAIPTFLPAPNNTAPRPDQNIQLVGFVVSNKPWTETNSAIPATGAAISNFAFELMKSGGNQFGIVLDNSSSMVVGNANGVNMLGKNWTYATTNLSGFNAKSGQVVLRTLLALNTDGDYVRLDGSLPMMGNLCMDNDFGTTGNIKTCYDNTTASSNITNEASVNATLLTNGTKNWLAVDGSNRDINASNWLKGNGTIFRGFGLNVAPMNVSHVFGGPRTASGASTTTNVNGIVGLGDVYNTDANNRGGALIFSDKFVYGRSGTTVLSNVDFENVIARSSVIANSINTVGLNYDISGLPNNGQANPAATSFIIANHFDATCVGAGNPRTDCTSANQKMTAIVVDEKCTGLGVPRNHCTTSDGTTTGAPKYRLLALRANSNCTGKGTGSVAPTQWCAWSGVEVAEQNFITTFGNFVTVPSNTRAMQYDGTSKNAQKDGLIRARDILLEDVRGSGTNTCGPTGNRPCGYGWLSDRLPRFSSRGMISIDVPATCQVNGVGCTGTSITKPQCPTGSTAKVLLIPQGIKTQGKIIGTLTVMVRGMTSGATFGAYSTTYNSMSSMSSMGGVDLTITQDQRALGSWIMFAIDGGTNWTIVVTTPQYNTYAPGEYAGKALAHVFCDFGA